MKRYVDELKSLYACLAKDASYAYPALSEEFRKDLLHLTRLSDCRGIHLFMVDLPQLGKHLDRCLAEGQYVPSTLPVSRRIGGGVGIPKLFRGLYLLIFDKTGALKENADVTAISFLRQFLLVGKKASVTCSAAKTEDEVQSFLSTDAELPIPPRSWAEPSQEGLAADHRGFAHDEVICSRAIAKFGNERGLGLLRLLDDISSKVALALGFFDPITARLKHGPGSVSDIPSGQSRWYFQNWSDRLERTFPSADICFHNFSSWAQASVSGRPWTSVEPISKLTAVPKTLTKPRLIASEPSEMMFCQQGVGNFMQRKVAKSWIASFVRFNDQTLNQDLARCGSIGGSLATIDLSAASDRVTPVVVGNLFRANFSLLEALAATRTRFCRWADSPDGIVELRKYSTMGNATTFPVETLVFLCVALTCACEETGVTYQSVQALEGKVSIFGDDIIVPNEIAGAVCDLLEVLYFKVNVQKSFWTGLFRESCGVDAFRGVCVTPAYWHGPHNRSPESYESRIETANNFYKKFLVTTSRFIERGTVGIRFPHVPVDSGVPGYASFVSPPSVSLSRWNKGLQREERWTPLLYAKTPITPTNDDTALLQFFYEEPSPFVRWESGVKHRPVLKIRHRWVPVAQFSRTEKQLI